MASVSHSPFSFATNLESDILKGTEMAPELPVDQILRILESGHHALARVIGAD